MSFKLPTLIKRAVVIAIMGGSVISVDMAVAQTNDVQVLQSQIRSIRLEIADLQKMVFKGEAPERLPQTTSSGAAPTSSQIGQLQGKLQAMEEQLRDVTGQYEVLDNRARRMEGRLDKLITDIDFRLSELERRISPNGNTVSTVQQTNSSPIVNNQGTTIISSQGTEQGIATSNAPNTLGTLSGTQLQAYQDGTLPGQEAGGQVIATTNIGASDPIITSDTTAAAITPGAVATTQDLPETEGTNMVVTTAERYASPEEEYKAAYAKLLQHDFDGAESAMQNFIDGNTDHPLTGNAMYWIGETYYARKEYGEAAGAFAKTYEHNPKGRKAPDSLLKLGMSLSQVGQTESACLTYAELLSSHPDANKIILRRAEEKRIAQNCPPTE